MARPLRIEYPGALYHVTARGNGGKKIFRYDRDRLYFLYLLGFLAERFHWSCHAYCLMDNHYHLVVETPEGNLSTGMRQLNGIYTQKYNWRYKKTGHIFQGRYKAIIIDRDSYFLKLCRYVVLNPLRAHMVEKPEDWKWSSYRATAGLGRTPPYLTTGSILAQFASNRETAEKQYGNFILEGISKESPWKELRGQIFLADPHFIEAVKTSVGQDPKEVLRVQRYAERPSLSDLFPHQIIADKVRRNKVIHDAHVMYRYTLKAIGDQLGIHYATVSRVVKRSEEEKKWQGKTWPHCANEMKGGDMIEEWLKEIKKNADPEALGMILVHNGIVRATSKDGKPVGGMKLSYDKGKLEKVITEHEERDGIENVRVWINSGDLHVGDDIMCVLVAGRFRTDVFPVFESLISVIKSQIVTERELE
jgi:putative transposase